jgi:uncharacterized protein (DUF2384 family)
MAICGQKEFVMLTVVDDTTSDRQAGAAAFSPDEIEAMQRAVGAIFGRWGATDVDAAVILGGISPKTYRRWREGQYGRVNRDLADRMSHILGIHRALRIIFAEPAQGYRWMSQPNARFGGQTPLQLLLQGGMEDLGRLRGYLDSVRGGW